jgi:hypothetical protein
MTQYDSITIARSQLEKIFIIWCEESKENTDQFESIKVDKMTDKEIEDYAKDCANYVIEKYNEL